MCGLVGALVFRHSNFAVTERYIARMCDVLRHRGPDGSGTWIAPDGKVGLGHRRLAIIDLSDSAAQPMSNEDGTLWVSFNGEIYNHREIRADLEHAGRHRWKTDHADTEVILHAFEQWGIDSLQKLRGMFAIALWDGRSRELWLIRDRIGIKPLYYGVHHGRITFASEIKALLQDPEQARVVSEEGFYHYLSFLTTPAPGTLFEGIRKVPAGTRLRVTEDGRVEERRYWDVWEHTRALRGASEDDIAEEILKELRAAVKLHKVSDVPVGVFLSGGIDSSTNAALFAEGEHGSVKTFTIGYEGAFKTYQNEVHYARKMAAEIGADYYERLLTVNDLIDFLPLMVRLQDEPLADPVCVPIYYVSKLARENGVIVCQVGEGADELFYGYPGWKRVLRLQRYNALPVPQAIKQLGLVGLRLMGRGHTSYYEWLRRAATGTPIFWGGAEAFTEAQKRRLVSPRLQKQFGPLTSWEALRPIRERFETKAWEPSALNWMTYLDLNLRLPELLLMRVDKMSMGVSLEGRVPFLDHKLVELAMSIPEAVKAKNGTLKYILKKAVRGLIPDDLIDRKKQGFTVPVNEWFSSRLGESMRRELTDFCRQTDFLQAPEVGRLIDQGDGARSWYLLNFAMWWREYIAA